MESQKFQRLEDWRSCAHVLQHHGRPSYLETICLGANMLQRSCFLRSKIRCSLSAMVLSRSLISFSLESLSWSSQEKNSMKPVSSVLPKNQKKTICTNLLHIWAKFKIMNGFKKKLAFIKPRMRSSAFRLSLAFCLTSSSLSDMSVCLRPRSGQIIRRKNSPWVHGP